MIKVDTEFQSRIPPLSAAEIEQLEHSLQEYGCLDPVKVWNPDATGTVLLLDGHHRLSICQRLGLDFEVTEILLQSREEALDWIDRNQLGRRNLTPEQASLIRGRIYNREKKREGRPEKLAQSELVTGATYERLGTELGVSPATIKRDGAFAAAVDKLAPVAPELPEQITRGEAPPRKTVIEAAKLVDKQPKEAAEVLRRPHVSHNSGEQEWYTPPEILEAARRVLGEIELDPATSEEANGLVRALRYYTAEDDGLNQIWRGKVWLNPPYASSLVQRFTSKLVEHHRRGEVSEALVLVNNATETAWGQALADSCQAVCFICGRVKYLAPGLEAKNTPIQGQLIYYLGDDHRAFSAVFSELGVCFARL